MNSHRIEARPTTLVGAQVVTASSARGFARHTHDQFGIGLVDRGAQTSASGRGQVDVTAGDLITVNPGEVLGDVCQTRGLDQEAILGALNRLGSGGSTRPLDMPAEIKRPNVQLIM